VLKARVLSAVEVKTLTALSEDWVQGGFYHQHTSSIYIVTIVSSLTVLFPTGRTLSNFVSSFYCPFFYAR
jgi:hypothetical protein